MKLDLTTKRLKDHLLQRLCGSLPGSSSHYKMLPRGRSLQLPDPSPSYRESAVLLLLVPNGDQLGICMIKRPATMKNHAGQIAFPGGKKEKDDRDAVGTALRETHEEIGISPTDIEIMGLMTPVYVQVSNFFITPVVGIMHQKPLLKTDASEVDEVLFVPLEYLYDPNMQINKELETLTGKMPVPGYQVGDHFVWGASAMMLAELADICDPLFQL
ncbi:MAG: CoA pyrophosphatase [Marinilabiliales bacterium]|nr:CoA pyrophosphatase [Marinilabiliales bacterium]